MISLPNCARPANAKLNLRPIEIYKQPARPKAHYLLWQRRMIGSLGLRYIKPGLSEFFTLWSPG